MRRTASATICFHERTSRCGTRRDMMGPPSCGDYRRRVKRSWGAEGGGADDDGHRLSDVGLVLAELDAAVRADGEGKLEAYAKEVAHGVPDVLARLCGGNSHFNDSLAVRASDDHASLRFFHGEPVG